MKFGSIWKFVSSTCEGALVYIICLILASCNVRVVAWRIYAEAFSHDSKLIPCYRKDYWGQSYIVFAVFLLALLFRMILLRKIRPFLQRLSVILAILRTIFLSTLYCNILGKVNTYFICCESRVGHNVEKFRCNEVHLYTLSQKILEPYGARQCSGSFFSKNYKEPTLTLSSYSYVSSLFGNLLWPEQRLKNLLVCHWNKRDRDRGPLVYAPR